MGELNTTDMLHNMGTDNSLTNDVAAMQTQRLLLHNADLLLAAKPDSRGAHSHGTCDSLPNLLLTGFRLFTDAATGGRSRPPAAQHDIRAECNGPSAGCGVPQQKWLPAEGP